MAISRSMSRKSRKPPQREKFTRESRDRDAHAARAPSPAARTESPARTASSVERTAPEDARSTPAGRIDAIDSLRGFALCLMIVYHFAFDLRFYGVTASDFEHDPFWLGFRAIIVSLFMGLVGMSLVLADRAGASAAHFWRRVAVIGACALAVTAASAIAFPRSFIYFGILHCIAVASVLAWPFVRWPAAAFGVGAAIIVAGLTLSSPVFDNPVLSAVGFVTHKPLTEDYVPLAPWAGVVFIGIGLGNLLARQSFRILAPLIQAPPLLFWLGRRSLAVYMVHQPILLGLLWLALHAVR
jgi:uncharacterized membrane protein